MKIIQADSSISVSNPAWITCTHTAVPKNLISTTMLAQEGHEKKNRTENLLSDKICKSKKDAGCETESHNIFIARVSMVVC